MHIRIALVTAAVAPMFLALALGVTRDHRTSHGRVLPGLPNVEPNDNRVPGGTLSNGVLHLQLDMVYAAWRPDADVDTTVTVMTFAEHGSAPRIPGPLLRAVQGTRVSITLTNSLDSAIVVRGLRAGTAAPDTLYLAPGAVREVSYTAGQPGTFLYWGSTGESIEERTGRSSQLTGAIVIDPPGVLAPDRIFVATLVDIIPPQNPPPGAEEIWEIAVNGLSWPHTERLEYGVGDTIRWRWINGTDRIHPMHLHGFHFRVVAKGDGAVDTVYSAGDSRLAVTEFMLPGTTFRMEWVPTRAGNWLMHCHMVGHITPWPERDADRQMHDLHDVERHPVEGMAGLVMGITTVQRDRPAEPPPAPARRHLRLLVHQEVTASGTVPAARRYVLQEGREPRPDSIPRMSSTIVLTRGEPVSITVVNRMRDATTVHWHGMELESYYDGVAGFSGAGRMVAPLIAPGDSFTVLFTPPRAGTYMYHTHMDEGEELISGLYAPMIILEPDETWDPDTDLLLLVGRLSFAGAHGPAVNGAVLRFVPGEHTVESLSLRPGVRYRLRVINLMPNPAMDLTLNGGGRSSWVHVAKDGADLPPSRQIVPSGPLRIGAGEAYDFAWTPATRREAELHIRFPVTEFAVRIPVIVR
jgi:manganese oxidase